MTSIRINPGNLSDALDLRNATSLGGCTTIDSDAAGRVVIARNWPRLSSGEELLWRVLAWLQGADDLPSDDDLRAGLDGPSQVAVARATNGRRCGSGVTA